MLHIFEAGCGIWLGGNVPFLGKRIKINLRKPSHSMMDLPKRRLGCLVTCQALFEWDDNDNMSDWVNWSLPQLQFRRWAIYIGQMPSFRRGKPMWKKIIGDNGIIVIDRFFSILASSSGTTMADFIGPYGERALKPLRWKCVLTY